MTEINGEFISKIQTLMKKCGDIMLSAHDIEKNSDNITEKSGDANFVTVFDVKVQETIISGLKEIAPTAHFLAEEKENNPEDLKSGLCFVIDPIDGTTNFIHDMLCSAVSVGLLSNGEPVFGAVYSPYTNEMFTAVKGKGAYLNDKRITVSSRELSKALVSFGTAPYNKADLCDITFDTVKKIFPKVADVRRNGSAALDICFVACGRTDGYFEPVLSCWDYAAGYVILTEAGGVITHMDGNPIEFGDKSSILCASECIYLDLLKTIN